MSTQSYMAKAQVRLRNRRKQGGLCITCGRPREIPYVKCTECRKRDAETKSLRTDSFDPNRFMRIYGITTEEYGEMLEKQRGVCAVCGKPNKNGHRLAVDHDHTTGMVRGLLCRKCNTALGLLGENAGVIRGLAKYLEKYS